MARRSAASEPAADVEAAIQGALLRVEDPGEEVIVVGRGSSVRRLLDGDGGAGGEDVVAELVTLGHAVVALVARNDDAAAERVTRPLARGRVRLIVLRGDEPQVAERQRAGAGR